MLCRSMGQPCLQITVRDLQFLNTPACRTSQAFLHRILRAGKVVSHVVLKQGRPARLETEDVTRDSQE